MNLYYVMGAPTTKHAASAPKKRTPHKKASAPKPVIKKPVLEEIVESGDTVPKPAVSTPRTRIQPARSYKAIQDLTQKARQTPEQKPKIKREIRKIKKQSIQTSQTPEYRKIKSIDGGLIGAVQRTKKKYRTPRHIYIGSTRYVDRVDIRFTFSKQQAPHIRTTAFLTDDGKELLYKYVTKYLKKRPRYAGRLINRKGNKASNEQIRDLMKRRSTFDITVESMQTHLNLQGKIELFFPYNQDPLQKNGNGFWIESASAENRAAIAGYINELATVTRSILPQS